MKKTNLSFFLKKNQKIKMSIKIQKLSKALINKGNYCFLIFKKSFFQKMKKIKNVKNVKFVKLKKIKKMFICLDI